MLSTKPLILSVILVLCLISLGLAGKQYLAYRRAALDLREALASREWPQARGRIALSEVESLKLAEGKGWVAAFQPRLRYHYRADGLHYSGSRIRFCFTPMRREEDAKRLAAKYSVGSRVAIYHAPDDPNATVLEPGHAAACQARLAEARLGLWFSGGLAGFMLLLVVMVGLLTRRDKFS